MKIIYDLRLDKDVFNMIWKTQIIYKIDKRLNQNLKQVLFKRHC